jgi:large subunit ribosomal protein L20
MPRVKGGLRTHARHKKIIGLAKGYRMSRSVLFKRAQEAVMRAGEHAFAGRKKRKRDMRTLWISRLNSALFNFEIKYSRFIAGLKKSNIELDRKSLSEMAIHNPSHFAEVVKVVKSSISN